MREEDIGAKLRSCWGKGARDSNMQQDLSTITSAGFSPETWE